jgi:hypothetical protein
MKATAGVVVLYKLEDGSCLPPQVGGDLQELRLHRSLQGKVAPTAELLIDVVRAFGTTSWEARS